ncbi:hypothetical protein VU08_02050 [Desulfobulbus sp. F5]|nr:hypothetical protein [Desulfobulbus sp. F5]
MKFDFHDPEDVQYYIFALPFGFIAMLKGISIGYSIGGVGGAIITGVIFFFLGATVSAMLFQLVIFIGICLMPLSFLQQLFL